MSQSLHVPNGSFSSVKTFLDGIRKQLRKIVVLVEQEFNFTSISTMSFVELFYEVVNHYTAFRLTQD
ncbi:hypothetical protein DVH24_039498 [Malus domestica]|uniref:Uncharacterized protein n=1 Tax=Malus domestica TaxID=3750 RepID=A0A498HYT8_MALDO|nr:hypothetical protein DVH24_039498 [Malus domestica]